VIGVSADSLESHRQFALNHSIPFPLLSDPSPHPLASKFGVPAKNGYISRTTIVIDKSGIVAAVYPNVAVDGHVSVVLELLRASATPSSNSVR
jgi:peroxiredoxin Q/BCP